MNVLEPKYLDTKTNFMYDVFKFGSYPVRLVGTGSMLSQDYPADFDFLCQVPKIFPADYVSKQFEKIFDRMLAIPELFFIEFKLQKKLKKGQKEAKKFKVFKTEDINYDFFESYYDDNVELCKIDAIIYLEGNIFKEVSCIYFFGKVELDMKKYIQALLDDQKAYYDSGKFYKSLKRLMLASKYENPPDTNLIVLITRFFNSAVGKAYAIDNQIVACEIYKDRYQDSQAHLRVKLFIKAIGLGDTPANKLGEVSKEYQKLYNGEALKLYKKYNLPVGHLPAWGTIKGGAKKDSKRKVGGLKTDEDIRAQNRRLVIEWLRRTYPNGLLPSISEVRDSFMYYVYAQGTPAQIEAQNNMTDDDWKDLIDTAFLIKRRGGAPPNDVDINQLLQKFLRQQYARAQQGGLNFQQLYSVFLRFNYGELPLVELRERMPYDRFVDEVNNYVSQVINEHNDNQADYYNREGAGRRKKVGGKRKVGGIIEPIIRPIAIEWFRQFYGNMPQQFIPDAGFIADDFDDFIAENIPAFPEEADEVLGATAVLTLDDWDEIRNIVFPRRRIVG